VTPRYLLLQKLLEGLLGLLLRGPLAGLLLELWSLLFGHLGTGKGFKQKFYTRVVYIYVRLRPRDDDGDHWGARVTDDA